MREEVVLSERVALLGKMELIDRPLVKYRIGSGISTRKREGGVAASRLAYTL